MIDRFSEPFREALAYRQRTTLPNVVLIVMTVIGGTLVYALIALMISPPNDQGEFHFASERGELTALSAIFLSAASCFSLASAVALARAGDRYRWVWGLLTVGFAFLAFDELLQFHERVGGLLGRNIGSGIFRNWNDIIVILYGVVALPLVVVLLPSLMRYRMVVELFAAGFALYSLHTLIDSTQEPPTTLSMIVEESAKLFGGAFLAVGTFVGFLGILWRSTVIDEASLRPDRSPRDASRRSGE